MRLVIPHLFLAIQALAAGQIPVLEAPLPLTDPINPAAVVAWDADGDGAVELMAYDPVRGRITVSTLGKKHAESPVIVVNGTFLFASGDIPGSNLFIADTNGDDVPDFIRTSRGRVEIWHGKSRVLSHSQAPDWVWDFPAGEDRFPVFLPAADLDGDGHMDLASARRGFFIFGIGTANPSIHEGGDLNLRNLQIIRDWDGTGKTVVAAQSKPDASTQVFEMLANRTLRQIDQVPQSGVFVNLSGTFPPQLVQADSLVSFSPSATIHARSGGTWLPESVEIPPALITDEPGSAVTIVLRTHPQDGRESLVIAGGSRHDLYFLESPAGEPVLLRKQILNFFERSETLPVISLAALDFDESGCESLAVFKATNPSLSLFGTFTAPGFVQGTELTVLQAGQNLPSVDFFKGLGAVGRTLPLDVDSDGRMDLVAVRTNDTGINAFLQPAHPDFSTTSYVFPDNGYAVDMVGGNFSADGVSRVAISPLHGTDAIGFYSLTGDTIAKVGSAGMGKVLASGDLNGNGVDELVYLNEDMETLNHSGSHVAIARAGKTFFPFPGIFPPPGAGSGFITQDQIILADGDEDGDIDVITFPSALGQSFGFHRNDGTRFSLHHMTSVPELDLSSFYGTIDGFTIGSPSQIFLGRFLADSPRKTLGCFSNISDIFGNPISVFTVFSGRLDSSVAVGSANVGSAGRVVVTDFDGDGLDDVITVGGRMSDIFGNQRLDSSLVFHRSRGDGTFEAGINLGKTIPAEVSQLIAEDMNGDGLPDIIAVSAEAGSIELFLGSSTPTYPSYGDWAAVHAPSSPDQLDHADSNGSPNLILYAAGKIPATSESMPPPAPPSPPVLHFDGYHLNASHPIPRLANGHFVDVKIEYSFDLSIWYPAFDTPLITNDPDFPQWKIKKWERIHLFDENGDLIFFNAGKIFFRFTVTYHAGSMAAGG